jgi:predicted acyltransferase
MAKSERSYALDALRGLALLGMALSGRLPWGTLPPWMYHAQTPPPEMKLNEQVSGITWVDLVFPFFLFSMGAAMPFALGKRLDKGDSEFGLVWKILKRGFLLALFAIACQHFRPGTLDVQGFRANDWMAIGLFVAMLMAWGTINLKTEIPDQGKRAETEARIKYIGWMILIFAALFLPFKNPSTWDWNRSDIILLVLANVVVSGGILYVLSRRWKYTLPIAMLVMFPAFLLKSQPWMTEFWNFSLVPWLFKWEFHKYLMIVIPGIWAGQTLYCLRSETTAQDEIQIQSDDRKQYLLFAVTGIAVNVVSVIALLAQRSTTISALAIGLIIPIWNLTRLKDHGGKIATLHRMIGIGSLLLLFGLALTQFAGGIRKDSTTISYFFVTSGLAFYALVALIAIEEYRKPKVIEDPELPVTLSLTESKPGFLALVGANPMIGYIVITNFAYGLVRVTGLHDWVGGQSWSPWGFAAYGLFQTLLVGLLTAGYTKAGVFMRT